MTPRRHVTRIAATTGASSPVNHSQVIVPVRFEWEGLGAGARALLARQELGYGVEGQVVLATPVGDKRVTLAGQGNVPLRKLVK